jgi:DNA replication licensing factor MCM5
MPRSIQLLVDRTLVDQVSPGARVKVIGIWSVRAASGSSRESKQLAGGAAGKGGGGGGGGDKNVRLSFLHVVGIDTLDAEGGRVSGLFSPEEEQTFHDLARQPDVYQRVARSIAPAIQGDYTHDIKRAIACLLFGGSRRVLPDGMRLRGDVNVLMLGDPSTAKSQFLKFVERVAPIGVYTSGKGSSAAGLTASVIRDSRGEFYLEGGAMVLADGGVVCIDEFDKMKEQDRVAIHEAMEQQTISVAKAGITTVLNARCSVMAAANPTHGTYDELKSAAENIDFMPTILSRFDLIFIVRDVRDPVKDRSIAKHVISVHVDASSAAGSFGGGLHDQAPGRPPLQQHQQHPHEAGKAAHEDGEIDLITLKRFIRYCRLKCAPVLSAPAAEMLCNHYVGVREEMRKREREMADLRARQHAQSGAKQGGAPHGGGNATIPLTTRQLEAVVRLAEALAKMELSQEATTEHVAEAIRLFKVSTLNAANNNALPGDVSALSEEDLRSVQMVEEQIKRRVPIGSVVPQQKLMDEFVQLQGFKAFAVRKALQVMLDRGEIRHASQQKLIKRIR